MAASKTLTTTLSTKGQVILPAAVRRSRRWRPGTRLVVEDTPDGVLLKATAAFAATKVEDVFGSLPRLGPPMTLEEMDAGVAAEIRRRHARD